jgi:hypothetical protein
MKLNLKNSLAIAALVATAWSGSVKAAPLLTLTVEASTTQNGTYSSTLTTAPAGGSTLFFEVFALSAPAATGNTNTAKTPNGTTDSLIALPNFTLATSSDSKFTASTLQSNFNTGSGQSAGTTGGSTIDIRAIEQGFTENDDSQLLVVSGTITVGATFTGITASTDRPVANAGSMKLSNSPQAITDTSESSTDPLLGYTALTEITTPEPSAFALCLIAAPAILARRRRKA